MSTPTTPATPQYAKALTALDSAIADLKEQGFSPERVNNVYFATDLLRMAQSYQDSAELEAQRERFVQRIDAEVAAANAPAATPSTEPAADA